jgi:hypothetical protein
MCLASRTLVRVIDGDTLADARDRAVQVRARATAAEVAAKVLRLEPLDPRPDVASGMVAFACPGFENADMPCGGDCKGADGPGPSALLASSEGAAARCTCGLWRGDSIELVRVVHTCGFNWACGLIEDAFAAPAAGPDLFSIHGSSGETR